MRARFPWPPPSGPLGARPLLTALTRVQLHQRLLAVGERLEGDKGADRSGWAGTESHPQGGGEGRVLLKGGGGGGLWGGTPPPPPQETLSC